MRKPIILFSQEKKCQRQTLRRKNMTGALIFDGINSASSPLGGNLAQIDVYFKVS